MNAFPEMHYNRSMPHASLSTQDTGITAVSVIDFFSSLAKHCGKKKKRYFFFQVKLNILP